MNNFGDGSLPAIGLTYLLIVWTLIWKGLALWRASRNDQRNWFIVLLILNTVGILELVYLFRFAKKRLTINEIKLWFQSTFFTRDTTSAKKKKLSK